jgi:hypothetical protein
MSIGWLYIGHHKFGDIDSFHNFLINHEHFNIYVSTIITTIIPILGIIGGVVVMYDINNNNKYDKVD